MIYVQKLGYRSIFTNKLNYVTPFSLHGASSYDPLLYRSSHTVENFNNTESISQHIAAYYSN